MRILFSKKASKVWGTLWLLGVAGSFPVSTAQPSSVRSNPLSVKPSSAPSPSGGIAIKLLDKIIPDREPLLTVKRTSESEPAPLRGAGSQFPFQVIIR